MRDQMMQQAQETAYAREEETRVGSNG